MPVEVGDSLVLGQSGHEERSSSAAVAGALQTTFLL